MPPSLPVVWTSWATGDGLRIALTRALRPLEGLVRPPYRLLLLLCGGGLVLPYRRLGVAPKPITAVPAGTAPLPSGKEWRWAGGCQYSAATSS